MGCCSSANKVASQPAEQQSPQKYRPNGGALISEDRKYLIHIIRAANVPDLDVTSKSDPYVKLQILDDNGQPKGPEIKTLYRMDNDNPIWNAYRSFTAIGSQGVCLLTIIISSQSTYRNIK